MSKAKEIRQYVHPHGAPFKGKILMVASSPAVSKQTGWPIGFWAAELTHPLHVFQEAGYEVELASTQGGKLEMDSYSDPTDAEEDYADQAAGTKIQPYRIESEARKLSGTEFKVAAPFSADAIADGNLITGQQQNSGAAAARLVVENLGYCDIVTVYPHADLLK